MAAMGSPRHLRRSRACRSGLLVQRSLDGSGLLERQGIPARSGGWIGMLLGRTTRLRTCPECEQIRRGNPARLVVVHARTVGGLRPPSFDRSCILRLEATVFVGAWWPAGLKISDTANRAASGEVLEPKAHPASPRQNSPSIGNGSDLGMEANLSEAADKLHSLRIAGPQALPVSAMGRFLYLRRYPANLTAPWKPLRIVTSSPRQA